MAETRLVGETQERAPAEGGAKRPRRWPGRLAAAVLAAALIGGVVIWRDGGGGAPPAPSRPLAHVTASRPVSAMVAAEKDFLGQFSPVEMVELRAQVGGTLTAISFRDGQIVRKGDALFTIDPRPYAVKLAQAVASLESAEARHALADAEAWRAQQLKRTDYGSAEVVDQRAAEAHEAVAASTSARAAIEDAKLDLEFSHLTAPFTGRIGAHQVSVGNLVSGSRAGASATTLLATIVSLDPIHLDFDMSEADYLAWRASHPDPEAPGDVSIDVGDDGRFTRSGTLDFVDNAVNRGSGTIRARATVANADLSLTPGQFARLRLVVSPPQPVLLVPAAAVVPDQSRQTVLTVNADGVVVPKEIVAGGLHQGLRIVRGGLSPDDRVIIDGLMLAQPGAKVDAADGRIAPEPAAAPGPAAK